jgi:hypothetical protein
MGTLETELARLEEVGWMGCSRDYVKKRIMAMAKKISDDKEKRGNASKGKIDGNLHGDVRRESGNGGGSPEDLNKKSDTNPISSK